MLERKGRIYKNTLKNIFRNKWLSIATILVGTIVFTTSSLFIGMSLLAQRAVDVTQQRPQIQVYFELQTPEEEVLKVRDQFEKIEGVSEVDYISAEEGAQLYLDYFSDIDDSTEFTEGISEENIQESLTVKTDSLEDLESIVEEVKDAESTNPYIEDVLYHEDFVDQLKAISNRISIGSVAIISLFLFVTVSLTFITISFNIRSHKNEIEIMHLVGSDDSYIRSPFILEGTFYSAVGSMLAALMIFSGYYVFVYRSLQSSTYSLTKDLFTYLDVEFLTDLSPWFVLLFFALHFIVGVLLGSLSSVLAVSKHLRLKTK